jgi:exosortase A-associated hydrolase 2
MNPPAPRENPSIHVEPRFRVVNGRRLFSIEWVPASGARGTVVYLPPLAEEMNRCRTLVAETARALAADGWRCIVTDLHATGESDGDSDAADWAVWLDDTARLLEQLPADAGPTVLWGLRTGALLAAEVAAAVPAHVSRLLLWQPVTDGSLYLNQYLRVRIASQMVHAGDKETTELLRRRLMAGDALEVAGYPLPGRLAQALDSRKLSALADRISQPVAWVEVVSQEGGAPSPSSRKLIDAWPTPIEVQTVSCPVIWQVHDRERAPQLVQATRQLLGLVDA